MKTMIMGLLGGGAFVQLVNCLAMLGTSRRKGNAEALGGEVDALERTINLIYGRLEDMTRYYAEQAAAMRGEIRRLENRVAELESTLDSYRKEEAA